MLTHYVRRRLKPSEFLQNPLESLVYHCCPEDSLVTLPVLVGRVRNQLRVNNDLPPLKDDAIQGYVSELVKRKYLFEVHGMRIERMLDALR